MKRITITIKDCYNQEVFNRLIKAVGIQSVDAFEDEDTPKATKLSFQARLDTTYPDGCVVIYSSDLKKEAFVNICKLMGVDSSRSNLCLETSFPELK